jgi:hypothetical protein
MTDDSTVEQLLERLLRGDGTHQASWAAAELREIAKQGDENLIDHLIQILQDENYKYRWWHIPSILSGSDNVKVVQPLVNTLQKLLSAQDEIIYNYTRPFFGDALAELRPPEAVDVLIEALHARSRFKLEDNDDEQNYPDDDMIKAAARALNAIGDIRGIIAVIERFLEGDRYNQIYVESWSDTTIQAVREHLLKAVESDDFSRSDQAKYLLNKINHLLTHNGKN